MNLFDEYLFAGMGKSPYVECVSAKVDLETSRKLFSDIKKKSNDGNADRAIELLKNKFNNCSVPSEEVIGTETNLNRLEKRNAYIKMGKLETDIQEQVEIHDISK